MRRTLIFALIFVFMIQTYIFALELPLEVPETVLGLRVNENILSSKGLLVYGTPQDVSFNDYKSGEYRYLGYNVNGNPYTNMDFPNDKDSGRKAYQKDWIKNPWDSPYKKCFKSDFNDPDFYRPEGIEYLQSMIDEHNAKQGNAWQGFTGEMLIDYLNIQSPPTDYCPGSATGWHKLKNGEVWYQTFQIPALKKITITTPTPTPTTTTTTLPTPTPTLEVTPTATPTPIGTGGNTNPNGTAVIKADTRGAEKFDVSKGIPSSENLYVNVTANQYLIYSYTYKENKGTKNYNVKVTKEYKLHWSEDHGHSVTNPDGTTSWVSNWVNKSDTVTRTITYPVSRDFSYWTIESLEVYGLDKAVIKNDTLPSGSITLNPKGYIPPDVDIENSTKEDDHIIEPSYSDIDLGTESIYGGSRPSIPNTDWSSNAESEVGSIKVKNDRFIINGVKVINDTQCDTDTPDPESIPNSPLVNNNVLYQDGITIEPTTENGIYNSSGTIHYKRIENINGTTEAITKPLTVNSVTVHTPVVCRGDVWNDINFNQEINPVSGRAAVILERPSKIQFTTSGQHKDILGYGNRAYGKYVKDKQVKFPFDVYINTTYKQEGKYLKADTWCSIPIDQDIIDFYVPSWVNEGNYSVEFREIALNAPDLTKTQNLANLDINNYIATRSIPVRVIGRLYGFRITDISDSVWKGFFRAGENTTAHSGNYFWVGTKDQDGNNRGNTFTLPLLEGSHPTIKNVGAIKTGYNFKFELVTVGNYFNEHDSVFIEPRFYFVDKQGKNRKEVDLYYNERFNDRDNYFIKIDDNSQNHANKKNIQLGNVYRNVPDSEIKDTSRILGVQENVFRKQDTFIGWFDWIALTKGLRTFIGDTTNLPAGVDADRVKKSKQKWYGQYYLPNNLFVCAKGTKVTEYGRTNNGLDGKESFWLKDGYIIVNFEIKTSKDTSFNPVLSYWNSNCNIWQTEGYNYTKTDNNGITFNLNNGDTVFYYPNKKSSDDYQEGGTH